jgi:hypothetical protein
MVWVEFGYPGHGKGLWDDLGAKWHVRVSKQSCKQGNHLILWGVRTPRHFFLFFFSKNLKKHDLTRPKVSKYSLTSRPEVIVVFHGEYKRAVTDTLKLFHCRAARTTASVSHLVEM